jgi:hypothetical protein
MFKKGKLGRPISNDILKIFDSIFFMVESGSQYKYVFECYKIPKSTFYRYLKIISDGNFFELIYNELLLEIPIGDTLITDC